MAKEVRNLVDIIYEINELHEYSKDEVVKAKTAKNFNTFQAFAIAKHGNKKVYKLRELLSLFDPVHFQMFIVGACTRTIKVKLNTFEFPDGERRVGIEFVGMSNVTTKADEE